MSHHEPQKSQNLPPGEGARLAEILTGLTYTVTQEGGAGVEVPVAGVTGDSRVAAEGWLFVALPGTVTDGHCHVWDAALHGCAAIVVQKGAQWHLPADWTGSVVEVDDCRRAYACAAENFFGRPAERLKLIGITGTNGKTTITYLLEDALTHLGHRVGVIGTVNYRYTADHGKVVLPSPFTTPEAVQLQALLFEMVQAGVELVIMEVSSHALAQQRIGNIRYDVAAFTNLSRDHLDYHRTMEEYFLAKRVLFADHLKSIGKAVISTPQQPEGETDWSRRLAEFCREQQYQVIQCGKAENADIRLIDYFSTLTETTLRFRTGGRNYTLATPLVGHFNMDNLLTVFGMLGALGLGPEKALKPLSLSPGAPGRLQRVQADDGTGFERPVVFVDYAHTPDALKQVLATLSALPHRELYCIFGCGGDRDPGKRPVMGSFAATFADVVVVTDDNPRTEDPDKIRSQIIPGVIRAGLTEHAAEWLIRRKSGDRGFVTISGRSEAIARGVGAAGPGDIVLIAGKGHEKYQLGRSGKRFFDDCLEAQCALLAWNIEAVALATGGKLVAPSAISATVLADVSTDSRTIKAGDIFVALKGETFDGHAFLEGVAEKGAGCLVVEKSSSCVLPQNVARVEVEDTLQALGDLARFRRRLMAKVQEQVIIGLTGSCGKTTVKEMTAAILKRRWPAGPHYPEDAVLYTKGNLNNLIGMPHSLLPISPRHRAAVLEMGMNAPGEIRSMARSAEPDICCITNVYGVHLAGLHDLDGVARAKGELFEESGEDATLIVNIDDERVRALADGLERKKITFSADSDQADLYSSDIEALPEGAIRFLLHRGEETVQIYLNTVGLHNVINSVTAAAIATAAGAGLAEIAAGLADFRPGDRRMVQLKTPNGLGVLNDTYNANPASMEAGLKTLVQMGGKRTAALLGDMLELGDSSVAAHRQLGRQAAELGVDYLGVVGSFREEVGRGAREYGMSPDRVRVFAEKAEAAAWLELLQESGELDESDWLLVKASRGLRMETIVERLTGNT